MQITCVSCGLPFESVRSDARTCSAKCRQNLTRSLEKDGGSATLSVTPGSKSLSVTENIESLAPCVTDRLEVCHRSPYGKEWDIMSDGYARGSQNTPAVIRRENQTAFAYFRIIQQETGFNVMANRVTREEFDKVDWRKLDLPNFDTVGKRIRERLGK